MESEYKINSLEYWQWRFNTNWIELNGIDQSNYFAKILIDKVVPTVLYESRSMLDFGCALGQLCNKWQRHTKITDIVGYDISEVACKCY